MRSNDLRGWLSSLPAILDEVAMDEGARTAIKQAWHDLVSTDPDCVRTFACVCASYDKFLELVLSRPASERDALVQTFAPEKGKELYISCCEALRKEIEISDRLPEEVLKPAASVIRAVRTLLLGLKKWELSHGDSSDNRRDASLGSFCTRQGCSDALEQHIVDLPVMGFARDLLAEVLVEFEDQMCLGTTCRVGPGAVAEGYTTLQKWGRVEQSCPSWYFDHLLGFQQVLFLEPASNLECRETPGKAQVHPRKELSEAPTESLGVARLCAVPKDLWKDRVITIEPNSKVMMQMLCRQAMLLCMARTPMTMHLRPDRQDWQQEKAIRGSLKRARERHHWSRESTLDFSDASDNITWRLVRYLFPAEVVQALGAARSYFYLQDGAERPLPISSYAGMGNATTFVVETLVFWAITYAQLCLFRGIKTAAEAKRHLGLAKQVQVYGDDLIVPADFANYSTIFSVYTALGWKLNSEKSFYSIEGQFRESCGVHAFCGEEVTPIRFAGYELNDPVGRIAYADKIRQTKELYPEFARFLFDNSNIPNTHVPGNLAGHAALNELDWPERDPLPIRWNSRLYRLEIRIATPVPLLETTSHGFRELVVAALCGYHYTSSRVKYARGKRFSFPCYCSSIPRRVRLSERWFPTISWGTDLSAVNLG